MLGRVPVLARTQLSVLLPMPHESVADPFRQDAASRRCARILQVTVEPHVGGLLVDTYRLTYKRPILPGRWLQLHIESMRKSPQQGSLIPAFNSMVES